MLRSALLSLALSASLTLTHAAAGGDLAWQTALGSQRAPIYNLDFASTPVPAGSTDTVNWGWVETDPNDSAAVAASHHGLAVLDGSANSWIDLNAVSGPQRGYPSIVMPTVGGPTTPQGTNTPGWSVEIVFKATRWSPWSKLFTISNGQDIDEIMIGFDDNDNNMVAQNYVDDNAYGGAWAYAITELIKPTNIGQWYHVVFTMQPGSVAGAGKWKVFVNGNLQEWAGRIEAGFTKTEIQGASYPRAVPRTQSHIGKSNFNDPNIAAVFDALRIYDYVLTTAQVQSFAGAYGLNIPVTVPTPANNQPLPVTAETTNYQRASLTAPIFNAVFSQNPAQYVGGRTDYQWIEFDPRDSAAQQAAHRGILVFNGSSEAYADLTVATGPKSIGLVTPIFGGAGSGTGNARGMTMELVVKSLAGSSWSKLLEFSTGPEIDSIVFGWRDAASAIEIHNYNAVKQGLTRIGSVDIISAPPIGVWVHIACSLRLTDDTRYDGDWTCYADGEVVARKTTAQGANFPFPIYRQDSFIARSAWNDPTANMMVDMVRIYDYAMTDAQARASANLYFAPMPATNTTLQFPQTDESNRAAAIVSRQPVFNAWFGSNPTTLVNTPTGSLNYQWMDFDPSDSPADQAKHRGVVKFSGSATSYIDLNTNIGPNSCGVVLPDIGGAGWGTGSSQGWTFEIVFKVSQMSGWAKLFDFGNGVDVGNIVIGIEGTDSTTMYADVYDINQLEYPHGLAELFTPQVNKWYHVVWQIAPANMTAGSAYYYYWVNGQQLAYTDKIKSGTAYTPVQGAALPALIHRRYSYVGKSNWNDPLFSGTTDALRVYDYLLPADQITRLADLYGCLDNSAVLPSPALNKNVNPSNVAEVRAWDHDGIVEPVFNANFGLDPRPLVGAQTVYTWMQTDPSDTAADQQAHKGLIALDGTDNCWVDLMTAEGPKSIGLVLPVLFGQPSGIRDEHGWTIELVTKIGRTQIWSKLINFATGGTDWFDSLAVTWNGRQTADQLLAVHNFNNLNPVPTSPPEEAIQNFLHPSLNRWYHITIVMQPTKPLDRFGGVWRMYVDGTLVNRSSTVGGYPNAVHRGNSYIGHSQWGLSDDDKNSMMVVDALRIYDRALLPTQVASLARMYGAQPTVVPEPVLPDWAGETYPETSSSSSSSLSGGAIAGIVIGSIVGAIIIAAILFCLCCSNMALRSNKKSSSEIPDSGKYGEMEPSQQTSHEVEMEETA